MVKDLDDDKLLERIRPYEVRYLYKYRSISSRGLDRIFTHNEIYLSDPTSFNDPFDCRPNITTHHTHLKRELFFKKVAKERFPEASKRELKEIVKKYRKEFWKTLGSDGSDFYKKFLKGFGVYCLSEVPDDLLMWAHYSDSHKGVCLQFSAEKVLTLFWEADKIKYQDEYPVVNIMEFDKRIEYFKALTTKSNHWKYEQERRIIRPIGVGGEGPGLYNFEPELLKGVILGALISESNEKRIRDLVDNHPTRVEVYNAKLSKTHYKLDIEGIPENNRIK